MAINKFLLVIWVLILLSNSASSSSEVQPVNQCYDGFLWDFQQEMCFPLCFHGPITTKNFTIPETNRTCASSQNIDFSTDNFTMLMVIIVPCVVYKINKINQELTNPAVFSKHNSHNVSTWLCTTPPLWISPTTSEWNLPNPQETLHTMMLLPHVTHIPTT